MKSEVIIEFEQSKSQKEPVGSVTFIWAKGPMDMLSHELTRSEAIGIAEVLGATFEEVESDG